jgi:hypothetical protein
MISPSLCGGGYWCQSVSNFDEASFALCAADDNMDAIVYVSDSLVRNAPIFVLRRSLTLIYRPDKPTTPAALLCNHTMTSNSNIAFVPGEDSGVP